MTSPSAAIHHDHEVVVSRGAALALASAFLSLFCIVGLALWGLPFFYDFMVQQFGWTRAQVTSGNALSKMVVGPAFGFVAGWMVDRFGPRRLTIAGILMAGVALAGLGVVSTLGLFYVFYVFNALGYVCGGPLPNQVLLSRWFDKSRGKAMGVAYLGIGLGGAAAPWLAHLLVERFGWQAALRILGAVVVLVALPLALVVRDNSTQNAIRRTSERSGVTRALKSVPFYLVVIASACSIAAVSGTAQNLKLFLSIDQHYSQTQAARVMSLVLICSLVGRLLMGWLADRVAVKYVMLLIYALVAMAIPFLFIASAGVAIYIFAVLFGIALGGDYMIVPLITAEIFGVEFLGTLLGIILTTDGVSEGISPWLVGHLRDLSGSYAQAFAVLIAIALLGAATAAALPRKARSL